MFGVLDQRFLARSLGVLNPPVPLCMEESVSVAEAIGQLKKHRMGSIVVTDAEGKIAGIFTERDVVLKVCLSDMDLHRVAVSQVMTSDPKTAQMTTTIAFALNMISQGGYRHIPIVDDDCFPLGIVSVKDMVDYIVRNVTSELLAFHGEDLG